MDVFPRTFFLSFLSGKKAFTHYYGRNGITWSYCRVAFPSFFKVGQIVLIDLLRAKWEKVPVLSSAPVFFSIILVIISSGIVDHLITDRACLFFSNSPDLKATISCRHLFCSLVIHCIVITFSQSAFQNLLVFRVGQVRS